MLRQAWTALVTNDRKLVTEVCRTDDAVDSLDEAVKRYVTRLTRESLGESDGRRAMESVSFSINLEHVGDIIDKNLMDAATKKIKRQIPFSKEGISELEAFHQQVSDNLKLAFGVFKRRPCAPPSSPQRKVISRAWEKDARKAWSPALCIWTFCVT